VVVAVVDVIGVVVAVVVEQLQVLLIYLKLLLTQFQ